MIILALKNKIISHRHTVHYKIILNLFIFVLTFSILLTLIVKDIY